MRHGCPVLDPARGARIVPPAVRISRHVRRVVHAAEPEPVADCGETEAVAVGAVDGGSVEPERNKVHVERRRREPFRLVEDALPHFVCGFERRDVVDERTGLVPREGRHDDPAINLVVLVTESVPFEVVVQDPV